MCVSSACPGISVMTKPRPQAPLTDGNTVSITNAGRGSRSVTTEASTSGSAPVETRFHRRRVAKSQVSGGEKSWTYIPASSCGTISPCCLLLLLTALQALLAGGQAGAAHLQMMCPQLSSLFSFPAPAQEPHFFLYEATFKHLRAFCVYNLAAELRHRH